MARFQPFLRDRPESGWQASVRVNLGRVARAQGALSSALAHWSDAWRATKDVSTAPGRQAAAEALGETLAFASDFGSVSLLRQWLAEGNGRTFRGQPGERVARARSVLSLDAPTVWRYGYDRADQLTAAMHQTTGETPSIIKRCGYACDPAGNRTAEQIDDAVTLATHDSLNRLLAQTPGGLLDFQGTQDEPGRVTINGIPATVDATNTFQAAVPVTAGTNTPNRRALRLLSCSLASPQSGWWYIGEFLLLTARDVSHWISITNVPGIPAALDGSKGTYHLPLEALRQGAPSPVLLRLPGSKREDRRVASTFEGFMTCVPEDVPPER